MKYVDDAVRYDGNIGRVQLSGPPQRNQHWFGQCRIEPHLERHDAAVVRGAVGVFEGRRALADRSQHGQREISSALSVLPGCHRPPDPTIMKESLVIAPTRGRIQRCAVVFPSQVVCVQQRNDRFLADRCEKVPFLEREDHSTGAGQVQIGPVQIFHVLCGEGIDHTQILERESHHGVTPLPGSRIVRSVGSLGVNVLRTLDEAAASPRPGSCSGPAVELLSASGLQIIGSEAAEDAEAAARRWGVNDAVDQVQAPVAREGFREIDGRHS